jgi:AcrR family transcriptional regulator
VSTVPERQHTTTPERPIRADARRNRDRILAAAKSVFAESGLEAQMDAVADTAGVGVGTVYRHFPTKDALLGELVAHRFEEFCAEAEAALADEDGEPFEVFADHLRRNAALVAADAGTRHALMCESETVWAHAVPARTVLLELNARLIARAQAAGTMRADFTADDIPQLMCGLSATMGMTGPGFDWRRQLELLIDAMRAR